MSESKQQQDPIERLARRRAGAKMGWYIHATVFVAVNLMLVLLAASSGRDWAIFPAYGWGLGLALHFISVFVLGKGSGLREQMVRRERERIEREQNRP